jgi:hypothetical protein
MLKAQQGSWECRDPSHGARSGRPASMIIGPGLPAAMALFPLLLSTALATGGWTLPADLQPLLAALQRHRFSVRLEPPPRRRAYGMFDPASRTIWVAPLTSELGIARQTLLHEAAHAAQSCPDGVLRPIGWRLPISPLIEREIAAITLNNYGSSTRLLEREAFAVQGRANAVALIVRALEQRCRPGSR